MDDKTIYARQSVEKLMERSRRAQAVLETYTQEQVDKLAAAIAFKVSRKEIARDLAELAFEETQMGNVESKYLKLAKKIPGCFYDIKDQKTVGVIDYNPETGITMIGKPVGVIGALIPSTNPEATPVFKGMLALRGRNSVVFGPHPASCRTTRKVVDIMRSILEDNGAPADIFICADQPSKAISQEIMNQCDVIMATGSKDMVRAAYSSGKPSYGVGVGNAVIVIDETVDLQDTARKIMIGKTGDNASGCSAENSLVIHTSIYHDMIKALKGVGAYLCNDAEKELLQQAMWHDGHLRREIVAKDIQVIAREAGITISDGIRFFMVEETKAGPEAPFSGEKLSLVLTLYRYGEFQEAVDLVNKITNYSGLGHSCGIHSFNNERILKLALETKTSRVTVRQPHGAANSGNWYNGLAFTFSLGCGTWGGNSVSENVTQKHYINITRIAEPIQREEPSEFEIYGSLLDGMKV